MIITEPNYELIDQFNFVCAPFYLDVRNHEDDGYSLNLDPPHMSDSFHDFLKHPMRLEEESKYFCQAAFNCFAERSGEDPVENRRFTHGDGHEWGAVFMKAVENEPDLEDLELDCELGKFSVRSWNLEQLAELGVLFLNICEDESLFQSIVNEALADQ